MIFVEGIGARAALLFPQGERPRRTSDRRPGRADVSPRHAWRSGNLGDNCNTSRTAGGVLVPTHVSGRAGDAHLAISVLPTVIAFSNDSIAAVTQSMSV